MDDEEEEEEEELTVVQEGTGFHMVFYRHRIAPSRLWRQLPLLFFSDYSHREHYTCRFPCVLALV